MRRFIFTFLLLAGCTPVPVPPGPGPEPPPDPTGPAMVLCLRPWSCTLDQSDADLTIRESVDAAGRRDVRYLSVLPGTLDERMQPHAGIAAYVALAAKEGHQLPWVYHVLPWVYHVTPAADGPQIVHQGPLDADAVLGWIAVPKVSLARGPPADIEQWLDVDFGAASPELTGALEPPPELRSLYQAGFANVRTLPGFTPIPRAEWSAWAARFPVERMAASIRHISEQVMGSCVGHAAMNSMEGAEYHQFGSLYFRDLSAMSMYVRIGRSPNSGAYVGDAANELSTRGILPATGQVDVDGRPYPHTFQVSGGFSTRLPAGWELTAQRWKAAVYVVDDEESAFRILMDCRLRTQFGRSSHSISGFWSNGSRWAYENSWGDWGDLGKSVGYDSRFYDSYVYVPVCRDEIAILVSRGKQ